MQSGEGLSQVGKMMFLSYIIRDLVTDSAQKPRYRCLDRLPHRLLGNALRKGIDRNDPPTFLTGCFGQVRMVHLQVAGKTGDPSAGQHFRTGRILFFQVCFKPAAVPEPLQQDNTVSVCYHDLKGPSGTVSPLTEGHYLTAYGGELPLNYGRYELGMGSILVGPR